MDGQPQRIERSFDHTAVCWNWRVKANYLTCFTEIWNEGRMSKLEDFGMRYLNGDLPMWWYKVWITVASFPLLESPVRDFVRPLGVLPCLKRQFRKLAIRFNKGPLVKFYEPQQIVFSQAGAAKLGHTVRMVMYS